MIVLEVANTDPESLHAMACQIKACTVDSLDTEEFCDCSCVEGCVIKLPVFAKPGGEDCQNDKTSLMYRVIGPADTELMELFKKEGNSWVKKADLDNNTLGIYYPLGTWSNYSGQELQFGYQIQWENVFTNFGFGEYYIKTTLDILGQTIEKQSDIYYLLEFTPERADETVLIHTIQNGKIRRSPFDWTDINWHQWIRFNGYFGSPRPNFITEEYLTNDYQEEQIQDEIRDEYTLEIDQKLTGKLSYDFIYTRLLANQIFITDFNSCNADKDRFKNFPVKPQSIDDPIGDRYSDGRFYSIKFTDRFKDNFKRNFK